MAIPTRNAQLNEIADFDTFYNGGSGSGNFGHAGRPGEIGGSAPRGTKASALHESRAKSTRRFKKGETYKDGEGREWTVEEDSRGNLVGMGEGRVTTLPDELFAQRVDIAEDYIKEAKAVKADKKMSSREQKAALEGIRERAQILSDAMMKDAITLRLAGDNSAPAKWASLLDKMRREMQDPD